jgi:hypothetical protein
MAQEAEYWRPHNETDIFYECPWPEACEGGDMEDGEISITGRCATGYTGNKCHSCDSGYRRIGKDQCTVCPGYVENIVIIVVIALVLVAVILFMIRSALLSAVKEKSLVSVYLLIFVNYLQVVMLMVSFQLNWPTYVFDFLSY